jgi:hypothetical protein
LPLGSPPIRGQGSLSGKNIFKYFRKKYLRKYIAVVSKYIFFTKFFLFLLKQELSTCPTKKSLDVDFGVCGKNGFLIRLDTENVNAAVELTSGLEESRLGFQKFSFLNFGSHFKLNES